MGVFELIIILTVLSGVGTGSTIWWKEVVRRRKVRERREQKLLELEERRTKIQEKRYALLEGAVEENNTQALALLAKTEEKEN